MAIKIPYMNTKTISVRLQENFIKELDFLSKKISEETNVNVSRNLMLELMIDYARENAKFELNNKEYTMEEMLSYFGHENYVETNSDSSDIINDSNKDNP